MTMQALLPLRLVTIEDNADDAELAALSFRGSEFEIVRHLCVQSVSAMRAAMVSESFDAVICVCTDSGFDISEAFAEAAKVGPDVPFIVVSEETGPSPTQERPLQGKVNDVPVNHLARLPEVVRRTRQASHPVDDASREGLNAAVPDQRLHDGLTGLGNRRLISEHCERLPRGPARMIGLLFIDLDGFKPINDLFGHAAGDALLVETGRRIQALVREDDGVARLGGDEFLVLLDDIGSAEEAGRLADRLTRALALPLIWGQTVIATTASIGVAVADSGTADIETLLIEADFAMHQTKLARKQPDPDSSLSVGSAESRRVRLLADIRLAVPGAELLVEYQPILDLRTGEVIAVEALMRWLHPTLGRIEPAEFIPLAEETGEIVPMGRWILFEACREVAALNAASPGLRLSVNVNVSRIQIEDPSFDHDIARAVESTDLEPDLLVLELTESVLAVTAQTLAERLTDIKRVGVRVAMDDFGTGYSSLASLSSFPLDYIKIDKAFVNASGDDAIAGAKLLKWVIRLGQDLGIDSVAEGIETPEQLDFLRLAGCSYGQGFLFGRPESAEAFGARLEAVEYPPET
jgi:diguanylate cyclase (GGDEF)-like protein